VREKTCALPDARTIPRGAVGATRPAPPEAAAAALADGLDWPGVAHARQASGDGALAREEVSEHPLTGGEVVEILDT